MPGAAHRFCEQDAQGGQGVLSALSTKRALRPLSPGRGDELGPSYATRSQSWWIFLFGAGYTGKPATGDSGLRPCRSPKHGPVACPIVWSALETVGIGIGSLTWPLCCWHLSLKQLPQTRTPPLPIPVKPLLRTSSHCIGKDVDFVWLWRGLRGRSPFTQQEPWPCEHL